ncbi:hypothetical protein HDU87_004892 [Geranomyces variabilis]|uniref:Enkurin domain-containing protein n=1 Tax=Geranomyces variabilis TaxID=109894 RepID=A0AAD5TN44_9FUNG|nr:hypothetical protein HDU87_004892 [Geranomyces variabilis]
MLRTPHRPIDQPTILVTVNPSTPAPIPVNSASESVYSLVYGLADQPAPLYRSRHAGRVRAAAKQPQGLNASFQRLATDDSRAATVPKTVPSTNTGLYTTPAGRTGSVKRVPPPRPGEKSSTLSKSSSSLTMRKTPPAASSTSSSTSLSSLKSARKSASRVPISHRTPAASKKQTPPTTKLVPQRENRKSSGQTAKIAPAVESSSHYREEDPAEHSETDAPRQVPDAAAENKEEEEELLEQLPTQRDLQQYDQDCHSQQGMIRARGPGVARLLTNQERVDILARLNVHWEHLSSAYRRLPISSDSPSKLRRKRNLESELQNVEADIKKFSGSSVSVID